MSKAESASMNQSEATTAGSVADDNQQQQNARDTKVARQLSRQLLNFAPNALTDTSGDGCILFGRKMESPLIDYLLYFVTKDKRRMPRDYSYFKTALKEIDWPFSARVLQANNSLNTRKRAKWIRF